MHRAYLEALFYAKSRYAFGKTIASFPPILEKLAHLKAEWISALYSSWLVTELDDRVDSGIATKNERRFHRILVNANKYLVSMKCTESVKTTIYILGGNGTIENFSVLPRLLRDSLVYELWEGAHDVLSAQLFRDISEFGSDVIFEPLYAMAVHAPRSLAPRIHASARELQLKMNLALMDPEWGILHFNAHMQQFMRFLQAAHILEMLRHMPEELQRELAAIAEYIVTPQLNPALFHRILGDDLSS